MKFLICLSLLMMPSVSLIGQEKKANYSEQDYKGDIAIQVQDLPTQTLRLASPAGSITSYGWSVANPNQPLLDLLGSDYYRNQLDFSDDQANEFKKFQQEYGKAIQDVYSKYPELKKKDLPREERKVLNQKVSIEAKKLKTEFSDKIRDTLVPRQLSLIESMKFNQKVQFFGFSKAISDGPFAEDLETTDKQKEELAKIKTEAEAEIKKVMAEMRAKAKAKMMKVLTSKQKKRVEELEGEKDEKKANNTRL